MKPRLHFVVPGKAMASQRVDKIPFRRPNGKLGVRGVTPPESREFMDRVAAHARAALQRNPFWNELALSQACFRVHIHFVRQENRGDADNMAKGLLDGIKKANQYRPHPTKRDTKGQPKPVFASGIFRDDARVTQLVVSVHTDPKAEPRSEVTIETANAVLERPMWQQIAEERGWGPLPTERTGAACTPE